MDDETAPHVRRSVLLTIDMQNDFAFEEGRAYVPGTAEVLPALARPVECFREFDRPIVHMVRLYEPGGSDAERSRRSLIREHGPIVAPGSEGSELIDALKPDASVGMEPQTLLDGIPQQIGPAEWVIKPRWGAFYGAPLQDHLDGLGVDTVVVCGY